ncbi:MAG: hypothetical protein Q9M91_03640 [Candidatus Dojkabacteria bacterium]|nr:hypothetical protein [Candidatus Dojkabacteria bacterium]MDQ7020909.1 hypothetical protein [Candidatus Dojkabacteria bacterium]
MFGLGKKKSNDPQEAVNNASKTINSGLLGGLTKAFMGNDFVNKANAGLGVAQNAINDTQKRAVLMETGLNGKAVVLSIEDTGALVNFNPVVKLSLKVTADDSSEFEATLETMVSKIAIPRVGDEVNVKYDATDKTNLIIV